MTKTRKEIKSVFIPTLLISIFLLIIIYFYLEIQDVKEDINMVQSDLTSQWVDNTIQWEAIKVLHKGICFNQLDNYTVKDKEG